MGCFGGLKLFKSSRIAPDGCVVGQQQQSRQHQQAISTLETALSKILQATQLNSHHAKLSSGALTQQLASAVAELQSQGTASAVLAAIKQAADELLQLERQQHGRWNTILGLLQQHQPSTCAAADALVSALAVMLFAQVVLDTAAVLQRRHQQLLQLVAQLGFSSCSSLSAVVQPANKAVIASIVLGAHAAGGSELKVTCTARRQHAFWDALPQLQQQGVTPEQLLDRQANGQVVLAKLFPRFVDEDLHDGLHQHNQRNQQQTLDSGGSEPWQQQGGFQAGAAAVEAGEGHGPRKEFFQAAALNWTTSAPQQPALLVHLKSAGSWWLNSALSTSSVLQQAYFVLGWLTAQSLTNRCTLGLPIAPLLFHLLLMPAPDTKFQPTLELLQQHDPDAAQSISSVLTLPAQQFRDLLQVEQLPGSTSRHQYVQHAVRQLLVHDVAWQLEAVRRGFAAGTDVQVLTECCLYGSDLAAAICGCVAGAVPADFKVQEAFRVVLEDEEAEGGGSSTTGATLQCLWHVLDGWDTARKHLFVKFVTGTDRLPAHPGSEQLVISFPFVACGAKDQLCLLGTLPQSHTCSNTLELPDYAEALLVTQPDLWREWAAACGGDSLSGSQEHGAVAGGAVRGSGAVSACPGLKQACCKVLEDRLLLASSCTSYGLDDS